MLKIGFDAKRLFNNFTGLGNYSRTLLRDLGQHFPDETYFLYTPKVQDRGDTAYFLKSPAFHVVQPSGFTLPSWWRTRGVLQDIKRHELQLFHGLSHELPLGIQRSGVRTVVTMHDLVFLRYPMHYAWADRQIYNQKFQSACRRADAVVAISESTKRDLIKYYNTPEEKIEVIYQSCHPRFWREKPPMELEEIRQNYHLPQDFLLYVGSIIPRKNLHGLIRALGQLPKSLRLPLVVVGKGSGRYMQQVQDAIKASQLDKEVLFRSISYADLPAAYQMATAFCYPSIYEGFGIPVLEALCSGTPVLSSTTSSLPEATGPGGLLADPHQVDDIATQLQTLLEDTPLRHQLTQQGKVYAEQFRGEVLCRQMMGLYQRLLG